MCLVNKCCLSLSVLSSGGKSLHFYTSQFNAVLNYLAAVFLPYISEWLLATESHILFACREQNSDECTLCLCSPKGVTSGTWELVLHCVPLLYFLWIELNLKCVRDV